jgi:hypothetical protein
VKKLRRETKNWQNVSPSRKQNIMTTLATVYSLLGECLNAVAACQDEIALMTLGNTYRMPGSAFSALSLADQTAVRTEWMARRTVIRSLNATLPLVETLQTIATASVAVAPVTTSVRRAMRGQSATAIATATRTARIAGSRLAGYDGRIVDPGQGLGTIVFLCDADQEIDAVSGRMRQKLIAWSEVEAVRVRMGLPEKAFGRTPGLVGLLGEATKILNQGGYIAKNVRAFGNIASAWKVWFFDKRLDSESLGKKEALISLTTDGTIECDNPSHPGACAVIADFNRRVAGTLIASDKLSQRIESCLVNHYGARSTKMGLYVSPYHAARALDLIVEIRPIAGRTIYAWSHTDAASISDALCNSFAADLATLEREIAGKGTEIKRGTGATFIERCERFRAECDGLSRILGVDAVASFKARIVACDAKVVEALDDTSQRFAMLELA